MKTQGDQEKRGKQLLQLQGNKKYILKKLAWNSQKKN